MTSSVSSNLSQPISAPALRLKLVFWLLLGALSVILAEVVSFSAPFPFFDFWGLAAVYPLYGLHTLVLLYLVARWRRPTLTTLFLAGAIFGLYEAYMTKVLWSPTWGDFTWRAGGIYLGQTVALALFWHNWMAFILPVLLGERWLLDSGEIAAALPRPFQRLLSRPKGAALALAGFAGFCGLTQGANATSAGAVLLAGLQAGLVFGGLLWLGRRLKGGQAYSLYDLLPNSKEFRVLLGLLLFGYLWLGLAMRPEALPRTPGPHLAIWGLYLLLGGLFYLNLKHAPARPAPAEGQPCQAAWPWGEAVVFWLVFPASAVLFSLARPAAFLGVAFFWVLGVGAGLFILARAALAWRR